ncbi:sensor histidine kinase [Rufibacter roseus]|uniref:histidine kinase n=1 Tax=Rufibacter roseus TaxID=1567108 RepID=A0ABW2DSA9_9BACT|nr:HAMP domain-containing sensor histidine kinase [Rufibacter roseus]
MSEDNFESLKQKYDALKSEYEEFAYIVSHDLKAPLRAINNLSGWIKEDLGENLDKDVQHNINLLQNRAERMERMINGILQFSRVERMDMEIKEINVQNLVQEIVAGTDTPTTLQVHTSNLPQFTTYSKKLEEVLNQLLQNAVLYNENTHPQITVSCTEEGEFYLFSIKDNGIGIPADAQEKVFKLFFTVLPKDKSDHLGAGLTIARKIVKFVGGEIKIESSVGKGSEFSFTWPKSIK